MFGENILYNKEEEKTQKIRNKDNLYKENEIQ